MSDYGSRSPNYGSNIYWVYRQSNSICGGNIVSCDSSNRAAANAAGANGVAMPTSKCAAYAGRSGKTEEVIYGNLTTRRRTI
jgi:hypothetical protein